MAKTYSFNVILDKQCYEKLTALSHAAGCSKGHTVRRLLIHSYAMKFQDLATCANGARCYVPQMHHTQTNPDKPQPPSRLPGALSDD